MISASNFPDSIRYHNDGKGKMSSFEGHIENMGICVFGEDANDVDEMLLRDIQRTIDSLKDLKDQITKRVIENV